MIYHLPTHHDRIARISEMSPTARDKLQRESYLYNYDNNSVNPLSVLEDVYTSLIHDAYDIGIEFTSPLGELFDSYYMLDRFLDLCEFIMPTHLYRHLQADPALRNVLTDMLSGSSLGSEDLLVAYVTYLGFERDGFPYDMQEISEFILDKIHTTPTYITALENLLTMDTSLTKNTGIDPDDAVTYLNHIQSLKATLTYLINTLQKEYPKLVRYATVRRVVQNYITTLTQQDMLSYYAWLLYGHVSDHLPLSEVESNRSSLQAFYSTQPLHAEYFVKHQKPLTQVDLTASVLRIASAHFDLTSKTLDTDAFTNSIEIFQQTLIAQSKELLTQEKQTLLKTITAFILDTWSPKDEDDS